MKKFLKWCAAGATGLALAFLSAQAQNIGTLMTTGVVMNLPGLSTNILAGQPARQFLPGRGMSLFATATVTNASTSNIVINSHVTMDGTNWSTTVFPFTVVLNGTNVVRAFTNFSDIFFDNAKSNRIYSIANQHTDTVGITVYSGRLRE